jgi:type IV pilus assembly protein PilB
MKPIRGRTKATAAPQTADLIDMHEAIAMLRTSRPTFYRWLRSGKFKGLKVGRQWRFYRKDIETFLNGAGPRIDLPVDIAPLQEELAGLLREAGGDVPKTASADEPVAHAVSLMIALAVHRRASDLHAATLVCDAVGRTEGVLRLRLDGCLLVVARFDARLMDPIAEQFKRLAACDLHEKRLPQDGRILIRLGGATYDLRVCVLPNVMGESVTVRILGREALVLKLDDLPFSDHDRKRIQAALAAPHSLVLCTGPTGSGKTTSLYACLQTLSSSERKVVTVEDPVEYMLPWATQVPVHAGLPFAHALRAMLRSDPDVLLIGEIRDRETLQIAFQCVLTGHVVLSSMHTDDAVATLVREMDIGVNSFLVADCPQLIVAQRLVRRLCPNCAVACRPTRSEVEDAADMLPQGMPNPLAKDAHCRKAVGCPQCASTGYRGRTVVAETLRMTPELGRALRFGAATDALRALAIAGGMVPMVADGVARVARGETTLSELRRVFAGH